MKIFLLSCATYFLFSCNENPTVEGASMSDTASVSDSAVITAAASSELECYAQLGEDTMRLSFTHTNNEVSGTLYIHRNGKDINDGTITGTIRGDTLLADYNFMSEGSTSTRQVAFLKMGDKLAEGFGPVEERDGKMFFKDLSSLSFDSNVQLQKSACR